jgi:hypothetical protein
MKYLIIAKDTMEMPFSPRDTACSSTHVTVTKCLYSTVETMVMSLATKNNVTTGYFSCSDNVRPPPETSSPPAVTDPVSVPPNVLDELTPT